MADRSHYKPSRGALAMLETALRAGVHGDPFTVAGVLARNNASRQELFARLQQRGLFDAGGCITHLGRKTFLHFAARQRVKIPGRTVRRMIHHPDPVEDGTCRCWQCGQLDEPPFHQPHVCAAAGQTAGFYYNPELAEGIAAW